jgi:anti-sigma-K factor RskA
MSPDVHALTGAYVLDAVSDIERASFERHLAECSACAQEVRELRETSTRLGVAALAEPPPHLKGQVMSAIRTVRQLPPEVGAAPGRHRASPPRWAFRITTGAAAVLLVIATVFGVLLVRASDKQDETQRYADSVTSILQARDARVFSGAASGGGSATVVFSRSQDHALVLTGGLPEVASGKDYQAWVIGADDQLRSVGVMPRSGSTTLDLHGVAGAKGFGVTVEKAGGAETPNLPPIMQVDFAT